MPEDNELRQIRTDVETRLEEYRRKLQGFHFGKDATARLRVHQCVQLLGIIDDAQGELRDNYRPPNTVAQLDDIIDDCRESSTFGSALGTLATRIKTRIQHQRGAMRALKAPVQSPQWNADRSVINLLITDPNTGQGAGKIDVQCAIQFLGADGQYAPVDPDDEEYSDQIARITLADGRGISSCHPTAEGLQRILGHANGYFATAGGAGPARRAEAIALATEALQANTRARVIWMKCTATGDGHSFTLVKKPSGSVDVLEAWAKPDGNGYLRALRGQLKRGISRQAALTAIGRLNAAESETRDLGYAALSTAYGDAEDEPSHHFEEANSDGDHDTDENISILCTVRDLAAYDTVQDRMRARYQVLADLRARLGA